MLRYLVARLLQACGVVFLVTLLTFLLLHLAPGDPLILLVGQAPMTADQLAQIRRFWDLDQPLFPVQYASWLSHLLRGDFGDSIGISGRSVSVLLRETVPNTLALNALALGLAVGIGIPFGLMAALPRHPRLGSAVQVVAALGVAVPNYWLALLLIVLFGLVLGWLPAYGASQVQSLVLPVLVLGFEHTAVLALLTRAVGVETLGRDHVRTARGKGLTESLIVTRHVLRSAMLPLITIIGQRVGLVLSGTVVVETVFGWPGVGRLLMQSIAARDYPVVQAIVLLTAVCVVVSAVVTDLAYAIADPRIRLR